MDLQRLYQLLEKYASGETSAAEQKEFFSMLEEGEEVPVKEQLLALQMTRADLMTRAGGSDADPSQWKPVLEKILASASTQKALSAQRLTVGHAQDALPQAQLIVGLVEEAPVRSIRRPWLRVAAAVTGFLILSTVAYYFTRNRTAESDKGDGVVAGTTGKEGLPGGKHAMLTLSDGQTVLLDSVQNGLLNNRGTVQIVKSENGRLAYHSPVNGDQATHASAVELAYNTIATPRGGFYQVDLSDGTEVWLNAASSLRYPEAFSGATREVEVTGEAYFEVASDKSRPFIVHARHTRVTVLGTTFNINAYDDEKALTATLLNGSVRYEAGGQEKLLRPGQQAIFDTSVQTLSLRQADVVRAVAWKNGQFEFENTELPEILRQISRWYNVDIRYSGPISHARFGGGLSRQMSLEKVLHYLESTGMHFTLDQHVIIVSP